MHEPLTETVTTHRVNYSETDQMGVVYHARHIVWLDIARTEHLRQVGFSYRELEERGVRLVVTDLSVRYRQALHFDDVVRIRCRVRDAAARRVIFSYLLEHADSGRLVAEAETTLWCLDRAHRSARLPGPVVHALGGAARP